MNTGGFAALWSSLWLAIIHNSPSQHPRISQQEKDYIVQSIGAVKKEEKVGRSWFINKSQVVT